jgi:hypothetical protein
VEYGNVPTPSQAVSKILKKFIFTIVLALIRRGNELRAQKASGIFSQLLL